ncbi:hypothetical protein ANN_18017 [Periplaneta americana]|uniref:Uncharacterized protein n=1 Tax=Periplaneta americana TaxID=6978 RepID=A0ABQ8SML1_PERAM|nr:hypothetical protein ANN_18017 [Periplaneta americana]
MGESRNAYRVLVGRPEGTRPLGRPRRRWEDNIKMDFREVGYDGRDWINHAQDRDQWRAYVRAAMNLRIETHDNKRSNIKRVLRKGSDKSKEVAYKSLVRPVMEYGAACWDPYRLEHIKTLEKIQKRALKCCRKNSPLKWDTLTDRRTRIRLCALFKTYRGEPAWKEIKNRLQPPNYSSRNDHSYKLRERRQRTDTGKFSFLNRTIRDWNALPAGLLKALPTTKNEFKNRLKDLTNRRTAPRFTQPPIKLSTGSFPGVKGGQSVVPTTPPDSSAEVMESMGLYLHALQVPSWHGTLARIRKVGKNIEPGTAVLSPVRKKSQPKKKIVAAVDSFDEEVLRRLIYNFYA